MEQQKTVLEFQGISKTFPGVRALDNVSFSVKSGEVHGLVGENGAGKSTLIKILSGIYTADSGQIFIDGKKANINSTADSQAYGIQVMQQEINVLPNMTVAENIMIYDIPRKHRIWTDEKKMNAIAQQVLEAVNLNHISPRQKVSDLSLADQQMTHLARIISTKPYVVVLDEPTAALTRKEAERLFEVINQFKETGVSIIYISHYLEEVLRISDRITVLRDGKHIKTVDAKGISSEEIVVAMIGKGLKKKKRVSETFGKEVLKLSDVTGPAVIKHIDLSLREREVLGLYGFNGAGKTETLQAVAGLNKLLGGKVELFGEDITHWDISRTLNNGLGYVTEDRRRQGLVLQMTVKENVALGNEQKYVGLSFINFEKERQDVNGYVEKMRIKTPTIDTQVSVLSGGNQQKIIMARCLNKNAKVILMDEPTVGIDVRAREEIYQLISDMVMEGAAVLLASSDINEVLEICDRIAIINHGRIVAVLDRSEATEEKMLMYAMGDQMI